MLKKPSKLIWVETEYSLLEDLDGNLMLHCICEKCNHENTMNYSYVKINKIANTQWTCSSCNHEWIMPIVATIELYEYF